MIDRRLNKAGHFTIGAVSGAFVSLALIFVISILNDGQTDPTSATDQLMDDSYNESGNPNSLLPGQDGNSSVSVDSAHEHPEIAWKALVGKGSDIAQIESLLRVAQTWIEKDGIEVIDRFSATLLDTTVREAIIASILQDIAFADPRIAMQQALELKGASRNFAVQEIIEVWATVDPQEALAAVSLLDSVPDQSTLQEGILEVWANVDPRGLLSAVESLPEDLRMLGFEVALMAIAKNTPEEAIKLMEDLTDRRLIALLSKEIATHWSKQDAHAALDWVLTMEFPTNIIQAEALMAVLASLTKEDPELAFQTARDQPIVLKGEFYRGLEVTVIQQLVESDIDAAAEMLAQVRSEGLTVAHAFDEVGRAYIRKGEIDQAFELGERLSERGRQIYNGRMMYQWARSEPEALFAALDRLPNDLMRQQAARGLIRHNPETNALSDEQLEQMATTYLQEE